MVFKKIVVFDVKYRQDDEDSGSDGHKDGH